MKKFLLSAFTCLSAIAAMAQYPTIVTSANNCNVFRNFNTSDEGFSSPSIYSSDNDVAFNWISTMGAEVESSGLSTRTGSLISPIYVLAENGQATIGFKYNVPTGTEYRIRIIRAITNPPLEILASTANGPLYSNFSSTSGNICLRLSDQDLVLGEQVRFEFTFRVTNHPNESVLFDDLAISVVGGPLPVTFEGFVARKMDDGGTKLLWNVGQETNVQGYYVESSTNGNDFKSVAYISATGKNIYSSNYADKISGTVYFRVRNIDFDGNSKYTAIIKVYGKENTLSNLEVYPMPAHDVVTIQHDKSSEKATITLYSVDGKIILQKLVVPNTLQTQINLSSTKAGMYMVRYNDGNGKIQSKTLVKN